MIIRCVSCRRLLHRTHLLLQEAHRWAESGKCPFWITADSEFAGLQGFYRKFVLSAESGGRFYVQSEGQQLGFGGGGGVRLLGGYGITDRWTLLLGFEFGGAGIGFTRLKVRGLLPSITLSMIYDYMSSKPDKLAAFLI